jgi:hypothetical protein
MGSGNGARTGGGKGQMTGTAGGTDEAKGIGGHCSAGIVGRAQGDGSGCGSRSTAGGGGMGTAVMGGDRARASDGLGQITGVAGGIGRAEGNSFRDSGAWHSNGTSGVLDVLGASRPLAALAKALNFSEVMGNVVGSTTEAGRFLAGAERHT